MKSNKSYESLTLKIPSLESLKRNVSLTDLQEVRVPAIPLK